MEKKKFDEASTEDTNETVENEVEEVKEEDEKDEKEDEINKLKEEVSKYKDKLLRTAAEYENFRKRTEKEKAAIYSDATISTLQSILPVIDSLELAVKSLDGAGEEYKKGIELVKNQLDGTLKKMGVEAFGEVGEEFNPNIHNAVSHIDDENEKDNLVSGVFQKGYKLRDRVIRHAMVQVTN